MVIGPSENTNFIMENIQNLNEMLKNAADAQMGVNNKLMKVNVCSKIAGLGENVDVRA